MLTHRVLANEQGYPSLPGVFRYNEAFAKKEHPHIAYFVDILEPACDAYSNRRFGAMFEALNSSVPLIRGLGDKEAWAKAMDTLIALRKDGTVGQIIDHLRKAKRPGCPMPLTIWNASCAPSTGPPARKCLRRSRKSKN